jgi:hypothetical protein
MKGKILVATICLIGVAGCQSEAQQLDAHSPTKFSQPT